MLDAFLHARGSQADLCLMLAPRHPERVGGVADDDGTDRIGGVDLDENQVRWLDNELARLSDMPTFAFLPKA